MKIAIIYAYNGSTFRGSQTQPHENSVEDILNMALKRLGVFERVISSSRTDKGVHAFHQVSSVDIGDFWLDRLEYFKKQLNKHANPYIYIKNVIKVDEDFHPRYDAKSRVYRYFIAHSEFNPFISDFVYFHPEVNFNALNLALNKFKGTKDFSAFHKTGSDEKTCVRTLYKAKAYRLNSFKINGIHMNMALSVICFEANGFLRSQVRMMVANALFAAKSKENFEYFLENMKKLKPCTKMPAPANGLFLRKVKY